MSFSIKKVMACIIFGIICVTFVFVGLGGNVGLTTGGAAATVNGAVISMPDYLKSVKQKESQYSRFLKDLSSAKRREQSRSLRQMVLEELIRNEIRSQSAEHLGLVVLDSEVLNDIVQIEAFQEDGRFQVDRYEQLLRINGYSPQSFESAVRKDKLSAKLRRAFAQALHISQWESQKESELKNSQVNLKFIAFDNQKLMENYKASSRQLEDFLKGSLEEVQKYYDTNENQFWSEEQVAVRHILIKVASKDKEAEVLEQVKALQKRAETEDFGELAAEFSQDPGSKEKKGDLGYFGRGHMVPEFEKVAFSAKIGEVSQPVKTKFGYHLIKVEAKKEAKRQDFDSVKKSIAKDLLTKKAASETIDSLRQDITLVDKLIKDYSLEWEETGAFSIDRQRIPRIGSGDQVYESLFRQTLSPGELVPELFEIGGRYYIIKLLEISVVAEKKEEKSDFQARLSYYQAGEVLELWLNEWQKKAHIRRNPKIFGN